MKDAVDTVDVGEDEQHGEVPVLVYELLEEHGTKGYMVGEQRRRGRVGRKKLDVEGVSIIYGNHRLAVIVQVFEQDLAQCVDLPGVRRGGVTGQEVGLFFESAQKGGKLEGDCEVGGELGGTVEDKTEVEKKFIAWILR